MQQKFSFVRFVVFMSLSTFAFAAQGNQTLRVDQDQVKSWNAFADAVYRLHEQQIANKDVYTETSTGGYVGVPNFYEETKYYSKDTQQLLSRVQREVAKPENVHVVEVFIRDEQGKVIRDYLAAYLPRHRNAPIQTLINLHNHHDKVKAYRQFDASGARIYEQCRGTYKGKKVFLSLEEHEFEPDQKIITSKEYQHCFNALPIEAGHYLDPLHGIQKAQSSLAKAQPGVDPFEMIEIYSDMLKNDPRNAELLLKRADLFFQTRQFDNAIEDYNDVISLDNKMDDAYFGRGMALGRNGKIKQGIEDLSVYIERNPKSSLAYTKRGVRYLWLNQEQQAAADLRKAIELNPNNAEANDDLGVIYARRGDYATALNHFQTTTRLDPTYMKGHHNMAMVYYITKRYTPALQASNKALALDPQARGTLLLKAEILKALGQQQQAAALEKEAEFLPEGNWSEQLSVQ